MAFRYEKHMEPVVADCWACEGDGALLYAFEVPFNSHVVDMVIAGVDPVQLEELKMDRSLCLSLCNTTSLQLDILGMFVKDARVSVHMLRKRIGRSSDDVHNRFLTPFQEQNLVRRVSRYSYEGTKWVDAVPPSLLAIELKLRNWREALDQARRNIMFSDFSYVVLDSASLPDQRQTLDEYRRSSVGLCAVTERGTIRTLVKPRRTTKKWCSGYQKTFQQMRILRDLVNDKNEKWNILAKEAKDD